MEPPNVGGFLFSLCRIFTSMKKKIIVILLAVLTFACNPDDPEFRINPSNTSQPQEDNGPANDDQEDPNDNNPDDNSPGDDEQPENYKLLSLGDSYTIGQSVCATCRFPEQLKDSLANRFDNTEWDLDVIAQTGWTTTNLLSAIASANLSEDYDLVTLLIGVNNQYQNKPFSLYVSEFPQLVNKSIEAAQGDLSKVIVVSIPDYAYTPFGQGQSNPGLISSELDDYNDFAEEYCNQQGISYVYITDITREGLDNPDLVASDNLHPSTTAYTRFVERLLPIAIEKLELE